MKKFSQQFNNQASKLKLKASEKTELRERLVSYMEYHPLPAELKNAKTTKSKKANQTIQTEPFFTFHLPLQKIFKVGGAMAVFVLVMLPVFAEQSVPGDSLYSMKVQFNEEIRSTLTFNDVEKVEWETERLNRRIAEARLLASEGRLTTEVEERVAQAVRNHSASAQEQIEALRDQDADAATLASITLDTVLEFQSDSLRRSANESKEAEIAIAAALEERPDLIALAIEESRVRSDETSSSSLPSYEGMMAKIEQNTTRIFELIESLEEELSAEQKKEIVRRSEDIDRMLNNAIETKEGDEYLARVELLQTLQKTQRLIIFMTELDVFNSTDIDDLIPVVLTEEEEKAQREELNREIDRQLAKVDALLPGVEDEAAVEKLQLARDSVAEQISNSSTTEEYREFVDYAQSTLATIGDMILIINQNIEPLEVPTDPATTTDNGTDTASSTNATSTDSGAEDTSDTATSTDLVDDETNSSDTATSTSTETNG